MVAVAIADDGTIATITPMEAATDLYLAPGLVDLQVNGYRGIDLNDGALTPERVSALSRALLVHGITRYLPTVITASEPSIVAALGAIAEAVETDRLTRDMVMGIHVEGPFLSPEDGPRGAHPQAHIRPPDITEVDRWQAACGGLVALVTFSPHWESSPKFVSELVARGIRVALGHTHATAEEVHAAATAGAVLSTHLGNGAAALLPRHPNFIWAQLADDRLCASLIADGHHLPADTLKVMMRAKGLERVILVSDTAALGGMAPGLYEQPIGGNVEVTADGRLAIAGTPYLAGAWRNLNENVALAVSMAGLTLDEALGLATVNPARLMGRDATLAIGQRADLIAFRYQSGARTLTIENVWLAGRKEV